MSNDSERDRDLALARLAEAPGELAKLRELAHDLRELVAAAIEPAQLEVVRLTSTTPSKTLDRSRWDASIGLINPSPIIVFLGVGGAPGRSNAEAVPVPASAAMILPVSAGDVEVGADVAGLAGGDAVVFALRFKTVQPFFIGAI